MSEGEELQKFQSSLCSRVTQSVRASQKELADMQTKSCQLRNVIRCASHVELLASRSHESVSLFKLL